MAEEGGGGGPEAEDRTEAPTPRRLERAREQGQVALSREAVALAALGSASLAMMMALPALGGEALRAMRGVLEGAHALAPGQVGAEMLRLGLFAVVPVAGAAAAGGAAATLLQTRGLVSAKGLRPQFSRLNPVAGLKRLIGLDAAVEFLRTLAKIGLVGAALRWALGDPAVLAAALHLPPGALLARAGETGLRLLGAALGAFAAVAVLDLLWVHLRHLRQLRMSRQDLREEMRESEGDPHVKGRLRQIRMQRSRRRMLAAVPQAAVVITNPTHYAVALAYDRGSSAAPRLVAKGVDAMAARIRAMAEEHRVPIVANPPLARALYRLELEVEIPAEHYQAVAEIIAYVWRLRGRG